MLTQLYAKNYKSINEISLDFNNVTLLVGQSGVGKTSVLDILENVQYLVVAGNTYHRRFTGQGFYAKNLSQNAVFNAEGYTSQIFNLTFESPLGTINYSLEIKFKAVDDEVFIDSIHREYLALNDDPIYSMIDGWINVKAESGVIFGYREKHRESSIYTAMMKTGSPALTWFYEQLKRITVVSMRHLDFNVMLTSDSTALSRYLENFPLWLNEKLSTATPENLDSYKSLIQSVITDMVDFYVMSNNAVAGIHFKRQRDKESKAAYTLYWHELSDSQLSLLALYSIIYFGIEENSILVIDNLDCGLPVAEIQPVLSELYDKITRSQLIIVSDHPEIVNYVEPENILLLARNDDDVDITTVTSLEKIKSNYPNLASQRASSLDLASQRASLLDLSCNELLARGWT